MAALIVLPIRTGIPYGDGSSNWRTGSPTVAVVQVIEYYHAGLDHYFSTADPGEIQALDAGRVPGWARTGHRFGAFTAASVGANLSPVCRYYGRPEAGLESHFYSGFPTECAAVLSRFPSSWMLESSNVFQVQLPDTTTGACQQGLMPVFRLYNDRTDVNHRYTTDASVRSEMLGRGYIPDGAGAQGLAFCSLASTAQSDFDRRKSAPGVVRWFDFDSNAQLGNTIYGANVGYGDGRGINGAPVVIDQTTSASGNGSLRFDIRSQSQSDGAGSWYANFSEDLSVQFGENSEFFIQWRQRFSRAFTETFFASSGGFYADGSPRPQGGIKQLIVTAGNQPGRVFNSCEAVETVVQTYYQVMLRFPIAYNSCSGSGTHGPYAGLYESVPPGPQDFKLQNATAPYCGYNDSQAAAGPGCFTLQPDEWMTFQLGITLGPRNNFTNDFDNSRFRFWGAREGQPSQLLIDWKPGIPGYFPLAAGSAAENQRFGKVFLLPYMTEKDHLQVHPLAQTWYDELIVSTQRIADTQVSALAPTSDNYPAWRLGKAVGTWFEISGTSNMAGALNANRYTIDVWNGLGAGRTAWYSMAASGHGQWRNGVHRIDLASNAPRWETLHPGSEQAEAVIDSPYYTDGLPAGRHTYFATQVISASAARDGIERVMLFGGDAYYGTGMPGGISSAPKVDGFRVASKQFDPAGTWADVPNFSRYASVTKHPVTEDVYVAGGYRIQKWSAATGEWSTLMRLGDQLTAGRDPAMVSWDQFNPSVVDTRRNRLVTIHNGTGNDPYGVGIRLEYLDLSTNKLSRIKITGPLGQWIATTQSPGMVYDPDNDRYIYLRQIDGGTNPGASPSTEVIAINPVTGGSTIIGLIGAFASSIENRVHYFPTLGGIAALPRYESNILFMPTR